MTESDVDIEELLMGACDYQGESMTSRERASVKYRAKETDEESYIRVIIDGLMASYCIPLSRLKD